MAAVASVKLDFITGPAAQAAGRLRKKTEELSKAVQKLERVNNRAWDRFGNKVRKTRRIVQVNIEKMKRAFGGLNLGTALAGLGLGLFARNAVQTAGKMQALQVRLKLLTGTAEEYERAQGIASRAAKQFGLSNVEAADGVTNIVGRLKPLGFSLEDIETTFFGFNTAAALAGVTASEASGAFRQLAQALGSGRLAGDEFNSISEQVPTLLAPIADELGVTVGELKKLGSEGKLTSEVLITSLKKIQQEGGEAVGSIIEQSALQRFKELSNAMEELSVAIGNHLLPAVIPVVKAITGMVKWFAKLNPAIQKAALIVTALASAVLIVVPAFITLAGSAAHFLPVLKGVAIAAGVLTAKFWLIVAGVTALVSALTWATNKFLNWRKDQKEFNDLLEKGSDKALESALSIETETLAKLNNLGATEKAIKKQKETIELLKEEINRRKELLTEADKNDIRKENELADFLKKNPSSVGQDPNKDQKDKNKLTEKEKELRLEISGILANQTTNAVMGLIEGTKTLGESLAGIAKSLASMFLNKAFSSMFDNILGVKEGGYHSAGGFRAFAQGGIATGPTLGLIGEAGEPEYVIPSSKMEGAMERYSAGARGQGVIPGSGTVASGSGAPGGSVQVDYTGPILSFNSEDYLPRSAVPEIINSAARRGAEAGQSQVFNQLKNSRSQRSRIGL